MTKGALIGKDARARRRSITLELAPADVERLNRASRASRISPESFLLGIIREVLRDYGGSAQ